MRDEVAVEALPMRPRKTPKHRLITGAVIAATASLALAGWELAS